MIRKSKQAQVYLAISILMNLIGFLLNLVNFGGVNYIGILVILSSMLITVLSCFKSYLERDYNTAAAMNQVFFYSGVILIINIFLTAVLTK